jgi:hypothetical protein
VVAGEVSSLNADMIVLAEVQVRPSALLSPFPRIGTIANTRPDLSLTGRSISAHCSCRAHIGLLCAAATAGRHGIGRAQLPRLPGARCAARPSFLELFFNRCLLRDTVIVLGLVSLAVLTSCPSSPPASILLTCASMSRH